MAWYMWNLKLWALVSFDSTLRESQSHWSICHISTHILARRSAALFWTARRFAVSTIRWHFVQSLCFLSWTFCFLGEFVYTSPLHTLNMNLTITLDLIWMLWLLNLNWCFIGSWSDRYDALFRWSTYKEQHAWFITYLHVNGSYALYCTCSSLSDWRGGVSMRKWFLVPFPLTIAGYPLCPHRVNSSGRNRRQIDWHCVT